MYKMLKIHSAILVLGLFLFSLFTPSIVLAQDATMTTQMLNLGINVTNTQSNKITGSVNISNQTNKPFDNMSVFVRLNSLGKEIKETFNGFTINKVTPGLTIKYSKISPFSIGPGQSKNENFEIAYPAAIETGNYSLVVEALDQAASSQGIASSPVALEGSGSFLNIDLASCKIQVGEEIYDYFEGPNIDNSQTGTGSCAVTNPTGKAVQGRLNFKYAVNSVPEASSGINQLTIPELTIFEPNQKKTVAFVIPKGLPPQVYEGMFEITDQSGQQVSADIPFRWIETGASVTITALNLDKTYYKKDETAKVKIGVLPSADLSWRGSEAPFSPNQGTDLSNVKLSLRILDKNGEICGEKTENLPATKDDPYWSGEAQYDIAIIKNCLDPQLEAKVIADESPLPLAEKKISITSVESDMRSEGVLENKNIPAWVWVLAALVVAGVIGGLIYWRKRGGGLPPVKPGSTSGVSPVTATTTTSALILMLMGVLSGDVNSELIQSLHLEIPVTYAQVITVKAPINSADESIRNVTMEERRDLRELWGNARDFSQNNTGGDSSVTVTGSCDKINITIKGTSKSSFACENWADGLIMLTELDGTPMKPENITSAIGDEIWNPVPANYANADKYIDAHKWGSDGQRSATYSITPTGNQKIGNHKLTVKVGISLAITHSVPNVESYTSSFENLRNCGKDYDMPCYIQIEHNIACKPPPACNEVCVSKDECAGNKDTNGCTECKPDGTGKNTCQPPPACNANCTTQQDCAGNLQGCVECRPDPSGQMTCQPPPLACNAACSTDKDCFGNKQGCTLCLEGVCQPPASCNTACTSDRACLTAKDGCTQCVSGTCRVPPACGTACTTKADCSGARDNCSECLEGTCTDFNANMCKCDGMVADIQYPSNAFNFEAFGKVEGADVAKAEIADVTFRLTKDNQVIAKSSPITPTVVESSANKLRVKAAWSTPPPPVSKDSIYRVFADVRCKPKRITSVSDASMEQARPFAQKDYVPKAPIGLSWIMNLLDKITNTQSWAGRSLVGNVMAQFASPSPNADSNLQLKTLNFVKLLDTDNCRFVMFKFDETLF